MKYRTIYQENRPETDSGHWLNRKMRPDFEDNGSKGGYACGLNIDRQPLSIREVVWGRGHINGVWAIILNRLLDRKLSFREFSSKGIDREWSWSVL